MTNELDSWDRIISNAILANKEIPISEVREIETVKTLFFTPGKYAEVKKLIEQKQVELILEGGFVINVFREYLIVVKFKDHHNKFFFATVYDSDELSQDPQIIDFFPQ